MAVENQYNIVKVNELRPITAAQGVDELIINDLDSSPLETKKITAENFALSIKDYILPIATEDTLGGIKIGNGLTINPITGVLSNDVLILDDLQDVIILNPEAGHVLRYNGAQWINQSEGGFTQIIGGAGLSGGGTEGIIQLDVNAGRGIIISNDAVTFDKGLGLDFNDNKVDVQLGVGLNFVGNYITPVLGEGLAFEDQAIIANPGKGIQILGGGIATDNGDGVTWDAEGKLTLDISKGLHFSNGKLELEIGSGLKFTGNVLEGNAILTELNDVEIQNVQNGQIIKYDSSDSVWKNVDVDTLNLNDLGDVTLDDPRENQALVYVGTHWENRGVRGVNDVIYKKVHNARIALSPTEPYPINRCNNFETWLERTQVTSTNLYLHPFKGSEVGLWDNTNQVWYLATFNGVQTFSLSQCNQPNTNYDVYLYNSGTVDAPVVAVQYLGWPNDITPPQRGNKDGIKTKFGDDTFRWMGTVRTTASGTSGYDLGGIITASDKSITPYCFISNSDSLHEVNLTYVFGSSWSGVSRPPGTSGWGCPSSYLGGNPQTDHPQINFLTVTDDPINCTHSLQSEGGNYAASNLGFDLTDLIIDTNNAPPNGGEIQKETFNLWTNFTYSTTKASGGTGTLRRSVYPGRHRITYWFDSCGGVTHAGTLGSSFSANYLA